MSRLRVTGPRRSQEERGVASLEGNSAFDGSVRHARLPGRRMLPLSALSDPREIASFSVPGKLDGVGSEGLIGP